MINESKEEVEYLMDKFYEYRILAAEAGANGADQEYENFSKQAMDYYERAIAEMDKDAADMTDHLSDEDKALPNVPINKNKMNEINKQRWAKIAGINENDSDAALKESNQEWEGSINSLKKDDNPAGFAEMADIILSKYPNEGSSTYRMEVYYNNDGVATGTSGGFAIENGNVYFDFKFKDGKVVDHSFNEQNY
jgi:hypothetical protein